MIQNTYFSLITNEVDPSKANILGIEQLVNPESNNIKRFNNINEIDLIYAQEPFPICTRKSIFLAGPTPRNDLTPSWRQDAIQYLKDIGYDGIVYIPEAREHAFYDNYDNQMNWERKALDICDAIVFWIPRDLTLDQQNNIKMAGLTTNIEFGIYSSSNKLFIGIPKDKESVSSNLYIKKYAKQKSIPFFNDLKKLLINVNEYLSDGALRVECECSVPLYLWQNTEFQNWYTAQRKNNNKLLDLKIDYSFVMPKMKQLFLWIASVKMYISAENRVKSNEFVLSRTNLTSVVLYYPNINDTYIILIKEYRSPGNNDEAFVYELPGGSSLNKKDAFSTALDEVYEEVGIELDSNKLELINNRQSMATLSAHQLTAYKYKLNKNEFNKIKKLSNSVHGLIEDSERTYIVIKSISEILNNNLVDWTNIGIIMSI